MCVCVYICVRKLKMGVKFKKKKIQIALLFLFTLQPQSDLCLLESLNFNSLEESPISRVFDVAGGGCVCAVPALPGSGALGNLTPERFPSFV